ncbi:MAG: ATP-binding protein, partial [Pseudomonadota bacterium]
WLALAAGLAILSLLALYLWIGKPKGLVIRSLLAIYVQVGARRRQALAQANENLRSTVETLQKLSLAVEQSPGSILITDIEKHIEYVNDTFLRITGYSRHEVIGQNPRILQSGHTPPATYAALWESLKRGQTWRGEFINRRKNGEIYTDVAMVSPIRQTDGRITHYMAVNEDITEKLQLAQARATAEAATQAKSAFLANMSHEIRTPLTAIVGFAESLLDSDQSLEERIEAIHTVIRNGRHLQGLIADILDFSKIEAGRLDIEQKQISFPDLLADIQALGETQARGKSLEFSSHYLLPLPRVITGDPTRIKQILINLIGNAVKFTPAPGSVRLIVSLDVAHEQLMFSLQDTGIGIAEEELAHLFKPFVQADVSTTRRFGGTGLGLVISRELARRLGGDIQVISHPGQGSLFVVTLATGSLAGISLIHDSAGLAGRRALPPGIPQVPRLSGRVLVAEDNPDNQRLISLLVRRTGAECVIAGNGQEAVEQAQVTTFDLVLMDMQMPVMGGLDAAMLLRLTGFEQPIVALTANATESHRDQASQAGCDGFLTKPIDQDAFFATLGRFLSEGVGPSVTATDVAAHSSPRDLEFEPAFQRIREQFVRELPDKVRAIEAACQAQDWQTLRSLVHQLKGVAKTFGIPEATRLAGAIEFQVLNGDYDQVGQLVPKLVALCPSHP